MCFKKKYTMQIAIEEGRVFYAYIECASLSTSAASSVVEKVEALHMKKL